MITTTTDDPLSKRLILSIAILLVAGTLSSPVAYRIGSKNDFNLQTDANHYQEQKSPFLTSYTSPSVSSDTLGSILEEDDPKLDRLAGFGLSYYEKVLLNKIIECESGWRNICNTRGCIYGQGIAQLINKTTNYCSEKLGKTIDPFNEQDSLECAVYLLTKTSQGPYHWGYPDNRFGSYSCWSEAL